MPQTYTLNTKLSDNAFSKSIVVTPSDATVLAPTAGLHVTGTGNIAVEYLDGSTDTWTVPANWSFNLTVVKVLSTGTTATGIKALY